MRYYKHKRSKAQLNAISRSYARREEERRVRIAKEAGLYDEFKSQTKYKTLCWFLKSKAVEGQINGEYV